MVDFRQVSVSSVSWKSLSGDYFNDDRSFQQQFILSSDNSHFKYVWNNIKDVEIVDGSVAFLTNECNCSLFQTELSSCFGRGNLIKSQYFTYYPNKNYSLVDSSNVVLNTTISSCNNFSQYGIVFPIYAVLNDKIDYNFFEIEDGRYKIPYKDAYKKERYTKILNINSELGLSVTDERKKLDFIPDTYTPFELTSSFSDNNFNLNEFFPNAFFGNSPCNSDIIEIENSKNHQTTFYWFSGNPFNGCERTWAKRIYSNAKSFIDYPTIDIDDIYNKSLSYKRVGKKFNNEYLKSFDSDLFLHISQWTENLLNQSPALSGKTIGKLNINLDSDELKLDGKRFGYMSNDILNDYLTKDFTISFNYTLPKKEQLNTGQIFGNYYKNGFGFFLNSGFDNNSITITARNGSVYTLNKKGILNFNKNFKDVTEYQSFDFKYIANDLDGARWVYDKSNHIIFKYETDDIISQKIILDLSVQLSNNYKLIIDKHNTLWFMDVANKIFYNFSENGWLLQTQSYTGNYNNFYIDPINGSPTPILAQFIELDSDLNVYKFTGINLYKNGFVFRHFKKPINDLLIDEDNNIIIVYDKNKILKLDSSGKVVFSKTLIIDIKSETNIVINGFKNNFGDLQYVVILNDNRILLKLDHQGTIVNRINLYEVLKNSNGCEDIQLNVRGDFTGYFVHKWFNYDEINYKFYSKNDPALTFKGKFDSNCKNYTKLFHKHIRINEFNEDTPIEYTASFNSQKRAIKFYLNSELIDVLDLNASNVDFYRLNSDFIAPFIIGGNSGKIGSLNQEYNDDENYIFGILKDFRWYSVELDYFQIRAIANAKQHWQKYTVDLNLNRKTIDVVENLSKVKKIKYFYQNSISGAHSNYFNIRVLNSNLDDDVKEWVEDKLIGIVNKNKPDHTYLNKIIWD